MEPLSQKPQGQSRFHAPPFQWSGLPELQDAAHALFPMEKKGFPHANQLQACLYGLDLEQVHAIEGKDGAVLSRLPFLRNWLRDGDDILRLPEFGSARTLLAGAVDALEEVTRYTDQQMRDTHIGVCRDKAVRASELIWQGVDVVLYTGSGYAMEQDREEVRKGAVGRACEHLRRRAQYDEGVEPLSHALHAAYDLVLALESAERRVGSSDTVALSVYLAEVDRYLDGLNGWQKAYASSTRLLRECRDNLGGVMTAIRGGNFRESRNLLFEAVHQASSIS